MTAIPAWVPLATRAAGRRAVRDPIQLAVGGAFYLVVTFVLASLWRAAASENGQIVGYAASQLVWYVAIAEVCVMTAPTNRIERISQDIVSGDVTSEMLRPASVLGVRLASEVGAVLPRFGVNCLLALWLAWTMAGPPPSPSGVAWLVVALPCAVLANIVGQHLFAAGAFWLRDGRSTWYLYQKVVFVLGGLLLPLEFLPDPVVAVARWLPFAAMAYVPARFASGHVEPSLIAAQVGWLAILVGLAAWAYRVGQRRLVAVGG